ncbi:MAG: hypothetical protein O3B65_02270 [Chloroflexi bacterium]|nr:hypothetical protein [Chloroflexota bacterium]
MRGSLLIAFLSIFAFSACGGSPTPTPTATPEPITVPKGDISTLLFPSEVATVAGVGGLVTAQRDQRSAAAEVDPTQVEHMDSFVTLAFSTEDTFKSLILTTIDFDSEVAATTHADLLMGDDSGMLDLPTEIGDASAYFEVNAGGIGTMLVFKKGEWVVTLHTAQPAGQTPMTDLGGLTALAQIVTDRL